MFRLYDGNKLQTIWTDVYFQFPQTIGKLRARSESLALERGTRENVCLCTRMWHPLNTRNSFTFSPQKLCILFVQKYQPSVRSLSETCTRSGEALFHFYLWCCSLDRVMVERYMYIYLQLLKTKVILFIREIQNQTNRPFHLCNILH